MATYTRKDLTSYAKEGLKRRQCTHCGRRPKLEEWHISVTNEGAYMVMSGVCPLHDGHRDPMRYRAIANVAL